MPSMEITSSGAAVTELDTHRIRRRDSSVRCIGGCYRALRRSAEESRIEQEREGRKILPMIRLLDTGVGPVAQGELHRGPFAGQLHAQPQLRSEVPVRGAEDVGFLPIGEPETEI